MIDRLTSARVQTIILHFVCESTTSQYSQARCPQCLGSENAVGSGWVKIVEKSVLSVGISSSSSSITKVKLLVGSVYCEPHMQRP